VFNVEMPSTRAGEFETELTEEFFLAVSHNSGITMHINLEYGRNTHHINEAIFVAFGDALKKAIRITGDVIPSTKGTLSL
jgi:imidazoleglycerol-phosphate dehydratase